MKAFNPRQQSHFARKRWSSTLLNVALGGWMLLSSACSNAPAPVLPLTVTPDAPFRAAPPALVEDDFLRVPPLHVAHLPNGLTVVVAPRPGLPLVSFVYADRAASGEPNQRELAGLTALALSAQQPELAGSLFEPAKDRRFLGATVASSGVTVRAMVMSQELDAAVAALAEMLQRPRFDAKAFELARLNLLKHRNDPRRVGLLTQAAKELLYGSPAEAKLMLARKERLAATQDSEVEGFHAEHYGPSHAALFIAGPVDPAAVQTLLELRFGEWATMTALPSKSKVREVRTKELAIRIFDNTRSRGAFALAAPCAALGSADEVPFELIALMLGGLSESALMSALRHESAASYSVSSRCASAQQDGTLEIVADVHPDKVGASLKALLRQLERLRTEPITEAELQRVKHSYLGNLSGILVRNEGLTEVMANAFLSGYAADHIAGLEARVRAITAEEIRAVAARYLSGFPGLAVAGPHVDMHSQLQGVGVLLWR